MIKVEIVSDVVCPWCFIGERRFFRALAEFPLRDQVEVVFVSYQLDPGSPTRAVPLVEYLAGRYGPRSTSMMDRVGAVAAEEGILIDWERALTGNTHSAHRLLRLAAAEYGSTVQRTLAERLFALHFVHGGDLTDHEQLAREADASGLDAVRSRAYLASGEGSWELDEELDRVRSLGVTSVPTFIFGGRWAIQGAQRSSAFLQALEKAAEEEAAVEAVAAKSGEAGEGCDDGVCLV